MTIDIDLAINATSIIKQKSSIKIKMFNLINKLIYMN